MNNTTPQEDKQPRLKLADVLITAALDLSTVFGIDALFKDTCIHFEPMVQAHVSILEAKYAEAMSDVSLLEVAKSNSILPDDFIEKVAKHLDNKPEAIHITAVVAFHYLGTVSQVMMEHCQRLYYSNMDRISQTGISTGDAVQQEGRIITGQF